LRFNDLTQTVLAVEERTGRAAASLWRQCVDMLAQHDQPGRAMLRQEDRVALVSRLHDLRTELTEAQRIASVVELGSRLGSPALVEFFASDRPAVCAAAMSRAQLPDAMWPVLLSRIGPTARGVLRGRSDITGETRRALEAFGPTDLVLGQAPALVSNDLGSVPVMDLTQAAPLQPVEPAHAQPEAPASRHESDGAEQEAGRSQIRQLVEKIERFTSTAKARDVPREGDTAAVLDAAALRHFPFETDAEGVLIWVGEASRTALIGLSIAEPALPGETGPDGHVAGAFARRSSFQHGRMFIGEGLYAGEWRVSAVPFFDSSSGRFKGFRGQARRPLVHESSPLASAPAASPRMAQPSLDSMRQIIHELRTPLNAILGFAEIIEQQLFGPAGVHYREMASNILSDAKRLLGAFDDIDLVARASHAAGDRKSRSSAVEVDMEALVRRVFAQYDSNDGAAPQFRLSASADLPPALAEPVQCERMIQHLVRTLLSIVQTGESVRAAIWFQPVDAQGGRIAIGFDRPQRLVGLSEQAMLDPGYGNDGDWPDAPLLGFGFSMRLVRSLALAQGGTLTIENDRLLLELPVTGL